MTSIDEDSGCESDSRKERDSGAAITTEKGADGQPVQEKTWIEHE